MFRSIGQLQRCHVIQMINEEVTLFTGSVTCLHVYKNRLMQAEESLEESLHFITAQNELTTQAVLHPKTLRLAHFCYVF